MSKLDAEIEKQHTIEDGAEIDVVEPQLSWAQSLKALKTSRSAVFASFACSSAAVLIGYDLTLIGSIIANPTFVEFFGTFHETTQTWTLPANQQLIWSIVQYISAMIGAFASGVLNDAFGRRAAFLSIIAMTTAGTLIELFSPNWKVWIVAKLLFGAAMGQMQGTVPPYVSELAPAHIRGFLLSLFQFWIIVGGFLAACVLEGTSRVPNSWSWKGAIVSQFGLGAVCLALFLPLVPESPYWLAAHSKLDKARTALLRLRGKEVGYDVEADLATIVSTLEHERANQQEGPSFSECFRGSNLRRTFIACLPMVMQHFLGYPLCGNYQAYFLQLSGFKDSFLITLISMFIGLFAVLVSFLLVENVGRRPQLLVGSGMISLCLLLIGVLGFVRPGSRSSSEGVAALCIIWNVFYYISLGAVGWTITSEMSSARLRSKTSALAGIINSLCNMGWSIAIPYLVNTENLNLGAKTGFVFLVPGVCLLVVAYFAVPETKGKTFAQMDTLFESRTSARRF